MDSNGNLYVLDAGNNRILRFPAPFKQTSALLVTDLVIGQKTVNSGVLGNEGTGQASAKTLNFGNSLPSSLAIDPTSGALWVPDPGNNRVLRFPASELTPGKVEPVADIVLGQTDFTSSSERPAPAGTPIGPQFYKGSLRQPISVAVAASGDIYVGDGFGRVLYFLHGMSAGSTGVPASRILGLGVDFSGQPALGTFNAYRILTTAPGLFVTGNNVYVADAAANRIVKYDTPDQWPAEGSLQGADTKQFSPPMVDVVGQTNLTSGQVNKGQPEPDATSLHGPFSGAFLGTDLWVVDTLNNRVISFPQQGGKYPVATRLVGQLDWPYFAQNLIEGREVNFNASNPPLAGVAIDTKSNPPHMYVADTYNNRILGFNDARNIQIGMKADIVIGQPDFYRSLVNGRTNDPQIPNQVGLNHPSGLLVDANGNLYVADSGNGRVLRFPPPFNQTGQLTPNLVLGQFDFTQQNTDVSIQTMAAPVGLAMFANGSLAVSDLVHNRVLIFKKQGNDFVNGQSASVVLGQPGPNSSGRSNSAAGMNQPLGIAVDSSDRLYVADFGNSRMLVWNNAPNQSTGASSSAQFLGLIQSPQGIVVSQNTGEIWVSNTANSQILRLPEFNALILNSTPTQFVPNQTVQAQTPAAAITLDGSDNLVVAESANRVTQFFPLLVSQNAASFNNTLPIAPGMLTSLYRQGKDFSFPPGSAQAYPWPTVMNDFQVTVNGQPAPIYGMAGSVLNFQVPTQNVPSSGTAEFLVKRASTNEIVAAGTFQMAQYAPAFFSNPISAQCGQIAATNDDNTVNTPSNQVPRDGNHYITFYLTGGGVFDGGPGAPPADGFPPSEPAATHDRPTLISGVFAPNGIVPDTDIIYSGAGAFPGGWQISMKVSKLYPPSSNNIIVVQINGAPSNIGVGGGRITCTFSTK